MKVTTFKRTRTTKSGKKVTEVVRRKSKGGYSPAKIKQLRSSEEEKAKTLGLHFNKERGDYGKIVGNAFHAYDLTSKGAKKAYVVPVNKKAKKHIAQGA